MGQTKKPSEDVLKARKYRLCVIDADIIAYRSAAAAEKMMYSLYNEEDELLDEFESAKACKIFMEDAADMFDEDTSEWVRKSKKVDKGYDTALKAAEYLIQKIFKNVDAGVYRFYLTGQDNFRDELATLKEYKGNRRGLEKPKHLSALRDYLIKKYKAKVIHGAEADDATSVSLYKGFTEKGLDCDVCLASVDKDLLNTAGCHYDIVKETFQFITAEEADYNLMKQILTGDNTDNIGGLVDISDKFKEKYELPKRKGVGPKTAELILADTVGLVEMYDRVLEAYQSYYGYVTVYKDWRGIASVKNVIEIVDEIADLVHMERIKGERWVQFKERFLNEN